MPLKSKFICPFCFEEHKISDVQFRCTNRRCKDVPDLELTRYETVMSQFRKWGSLHLKPRQADCRFRKVPDVRNAIA